MDKLEQTLKQLKQNKRLGLMTHVVVGYSSLEKTVQLVKLMAEEGVDIAELQIPFSDPLADGPTIMKACEKSLNNGTKVKDAFDIAGKLSKEVSTPLLFMAYYNTVFNYSSSGAKRSREVDSGQSQNDGSRQARTIKQSSMSSVEAFCRDAKEAGISGLIVPDVPLEEEGEEHFIAYCKKYKLANIRVVSPASTSIRLQKNAEVGTGFVYATARQGITGAKKTLNSNIIEYLGRVKKHFAIPVAVGFGISKKEHLQSLKNHADIAIIGSAIIDALNKGGIKEVRGFIRSLDVLYPSAFKI